MILSESKPLFKDILRTLHSEYEATNNLLLLNNLSIFIYIHLWFLK